MDLTSTSSHQPPDPSFPTHFGGRRRRDRSTECPADGDRYRLLVEHSPVMVWRSDRDKKCDYFNRVWLAFTGRTISQESGDGWADGVHPEDLERLFQNLHVKLRSAGAIRNGIPDAAPRWRVSLDFRSRRSLCGRHGDFRGYIGSCVDVTDRKEADAALRRSEDQFRRWYSKSTIM